MSLLPGPGPRPSLRRRPQPVDSPPLAYAVGLVAVGAGTIILPVSYLAITYAEICLLRQHAVADFGWLVGPDSGFFPGLGYLVLLAFLAVFAFFLVRPFVAVHRIVRSDPSLLPGDEPRLHAFIQQICTSLGSPAPMRIQVSMDVNASARLAPGWLNFWTGGLELVLGLPLVRGLELGQFAGVLAHELGHFRQGTAMRMVHGIRALNQWFSRAATREDPWERDLEGRRHRMDPFLVGLYWFARICAWLARQILKGHVRAGQGVSCLLLRQMEHQADRAAIGLVGGETFASMVLEAKVIEAAWGLANRSLGLSLREGRLADDLPALVSAHTRVFIPEVRRKMERSLLAEKAALFDTHPSLADRVRHARRSVSRGKFRSSGASHTLFSDFGALSRRTTAVFYQRDLGADFNPSRLMATSDLVTGQNDVQVCEAAVTGYFLGLLTNLRPIWLAPADLETDQQPDLLGRLLAARSLIESEHGMAAEAFRAYAAADARMLDAVQALALMRANFWIEPGDFQLRKGGAAQAAKAFGEAEQEQQGIADRLRAFEAAMRTRIGSALGLLGDPRVRERLGDARACSQEVARLLPVLAILGSVQPRLESLRRSFHGMGILLDNLDGHESSPEIDVQLDTHALAIRLELVSLSAAFQDVDYPFGMVASSSRLVDYVLDRLPLERDFAAHYNAAEEALGRCYALYFRILGRLSLSAGRVEGVLGMGPLRVGQ
ncbi:MAG: M48 family metallopeptidase [Fibrobacteria bacterium]